MRLKKADDKSKRITLLESLLSDPRVSTQGRDWLHDQLSNMRKGIQGEKDAAHYLDAYFGENSKNIALLHDLRIEVDGQVAQIDHLIINRAFEFILLESKNFSGNLIVNERGEFSVAYGNAKTIGIPSPFEQSKRQALILDALRKKLGIAGRLGTSPKFIHVVLAHPQTTISRPQKWQMPDCFLMKADAFASWYQTEHVESGSFFDAIKGLSNVRSRATVEDWGKLLLQAHQASSLFEIPEFARPKITSAATALQPPQAEPQPAATATQTSRTEATAPAHAPSRYFCAQCKCGISKTVFDFCFNNKTRFNGRAYCMTHQKQFEFSGRVEAPKNALKFGAIKQK